MIIIKIRDDFTKSPGGRLIEEGAYSGELFRNNILSPKYKEALEKNEKLIVDLDGCYGFATSFLEEAFGGLCRELKDNNILKHIEIISEDEPGLVEDIESYVKKALK